MNAAAELGGTNRTDLMALFYAGSNNAKGKIVQAQNVATGDKNSAGARIQGVVNIRPCISSVLRVSRTRLLTFLGFWRILLSQELRYQTKVDRPLAGH